MVSSTGLPLRGADVRVVAVNGRDNRRALTDEEGGFDVSGLTPGRFTVTASKAGYAMKQTGPGGAFGAIDPVAVGGGDTVTVVIPLGVAGAIFGRVYDEYGERVTGAKVQALRLGFVDGERRLTPVGVADESDDLGAFRVYGLPPGDYYVSATVRVRDRPTALTPADATVTYFPGAARSVDAPRLRIEAGQEQGGIDIVVPSERRGVTIAGVVLNSTGDPVVGGSLQLFDAEAASASPVSAAVGILVLTENDGRFSVPNVPPGHYVAEVTGRSIGPETSERASASIEVAGADVNGLVISTRPPITVSGTVIVDGGQAPPRDFRIGISGRSVGSATGRAFSIQATGNSFSLPMLSGGRYAFDISMGDSWMLKSLEVDGKDVTDRIVDLRDAGATASMRVTITNFVGEISGRVASSNINGINVVVFPSDTAKRSRLTRLVRAVAADAKGRFAVRGLPRGVYSVAVARTIDPEQLDDPEFFENLGRGATSISLGEGEQRVDLLLRAP